MKLLGLECSGKTASAAIGNGGTLLAETYLNCGLTHSQTLLPMVEELLKQTSIKMSEIDAVAVSCGPGSFTGVRIGVALAKGLAQGKNLPCYGVSSLEVLAYNTDGYAGMGQSFIVCPVMDARRDQLYNALFEWQENKLIRICADRAVSFSDLNDELQTMNKTVLLLGDGADIFYPVAQTKNKVILLPQQQRFGHGWGVIKAAEGGNALSADELLPTYLRLSQAERELEKREKSTERPAN